MCYLVVKLILVDIHGLSNLDGIRALGTACIAVALSLSVIHCIAWTALGAEYVQYIQRRAHRALAVNGDESGLGNSSDVPTSRKGKANIGRLASLAGPEKWLLLAGLVMMLIASISNIAAPYFFGKVIDSAAGDDPSNSELSKNVIILGIIFGTGSVAAAIRAWIFTLAGQRSVARVRTRLFHHIIQQEIAFFDQNRTGELLNRLSSDTQVLQNACTVNISMLTRYLVQIAGSLALMFVLSWRLTLVLLSVVGSLVTIL